VIVLGILFCGGCACFAGQVIHVDESASGANDGSSWAGAYMFLQDALAAAVEGDQVHVAGGTYKPDRGRGPGGWGTDTRLSNLRAAWRSVGG